MMGKGGAPYQREDTKAEVCCLVDTQVLIELGENTSAELLPVLVKCFIDDTRMRKREIIDALEQGNSQIVLHHVHSLGSSAATYGAMVLHFQCRHIETRLLDKDNKTAFEVAKSFETIVDSTLHVMSQFQCGLNGQEVEPPKS